MPMHRLQATMGVWQGEFPAFPSCCEHWMWQLCWWVKEEGDRENIAFALFTESFKKDKST